MTTHELNAITVADDLVEFLENHPSHLAGVHSVFHHAVNLLVDEDVLITLTNRDDITPMGLRVDCAASFGEYLKAGDQVCLSLDRFKAVNRLFTLNLQDAGVWKTRSISSQGARPIEDVARIRIALINWLAKQPAQGLLPLLSRLAQLSASSRSAVDNIYSRYIADDLATFTKAINTSNWEHTLRIADQLVGFGMGSTPSCDDFLAAYLVVLKITEAYFPGRFPWVSEFNQTIASKAKSRTTLISANMLRHAADGKISRSHQRLITACLFKNQADLTQLASQVIQHGASSGGDFLLGLICALEWFQKTMTDNLKEGEHAWVELKRQQPVPGI